jgi:hypothetical protein
MKKYKACCGTRCLVHGCKINENGGCYCACRASDHIGTLKSIKSGHTLTCGRGTIYYPNEESAKEHISRMNENDRMAYEKLIEEIDGKIKEAEEYLEKFEDKI